MDTRPGRSGRISRRALLGSPFYESDALLRQYLTFHYARPVELLPYPTGPRSAVDFAVRAVRECLQRDLLPSHARALDLGCAVGRSTFELARFCERVVGIDLSRRFIAAAKVLQKRGELTYARAEEVETTVPAVARVPRSIRRERVSFEVGDATALRADLGTFDVVLMANLMDRLSDPRRCLRRMSGLVNPGGQLMIMSPFTWLRAFTPRAKWLGGYMRAGRPVRSFDGMRETLGKDFRLAVRRDMPFLIPDHRRKFQWVVTDASVWERR